MVLTEPHTDHRVRASRPTGHHARSAGRSVGIAGPSARWPARRAQSTIIAQADTLYNCARCAKHRLRLGLGATQDRALVGHDHNGTVAVVRASGADRAETGLAGSAVAVGPENQQVGGG